MATGPAFSHGLFNGGLTYIARSGGRSAASVGGFMATYNGGICSLERLRAKRDVLNPFVIGGVIGVAGALPGYLQPLPTAPWAYRNPRALVGGGVGSAMLCSFFYMLSHGVSERPAAPPAPVPATAPATASPPAPPVHSDVGYPQPATVQVEMPGFAQPATPDAGTEVPGFADRLSELPADHAVPAPVFGAEPPPAPLEPPPAGGGGGEQIVDPWASK